MTKSLELFRDFYGCHASIRNTAGGAARLVVRNPSGKIIKTGNYTSRKGARIAMGRMSDGWYEK